MPSPRTIRGPPAPLWCALGHLPPPAGLLATYHRAGQPVAPHAGLRLRRHASRHRHPEAGSGITRGGQGRRPQGLYHVHPGRGGPAGPRQTAQRQSRRPSLQARPPPVPEAFRGLPVTGGGVWRGTWPLCCMLHACRMRRRRLERTGPGTLVALGQVDEKAEVRAEIRAEGQAAWPRRRGLRAACCSDAEMRPQGASRGRPGAGSMRHATRSTGPVLLLSWRAAAPVRRQCARSAVDAGAAPRLRSRDHCSTHGWVRQARLAAKD